MAAMLRQNAISHFANTARFTPNAANYGGVRFMKQLNYDSRTLILQNVRTAEKQPVPEHYTKAQYIYLCKLIRRKKISKPFFEFLLNELYNETDWRNLSYEQMYELIHVLTFYKYHKN